MKKLLSVLLLIVLVGLSSVEKTSAADYNPNLIITNTDFVNINAMDTDAIQRFLVSKNSYLKDFSEGGRSAARIIFDASHGYGDASGSINGITVNSSTGTIAPGVILTTLQKEQGLISKTSRDENALNKAMGYACPDAGSCNPSYWGFTKQVENAAWQLRYNYERAQGHGFPDYQVGQSFSFNDTGAYYSSGIHTGVFVNRATSALYRYTPHVYDGNYNFWRYFHNIYRFQVGEYSASFAGQSRYPSLTNGQTATLTIRYRNTGSSTWRRGVVNLATVNQDFSWRASSHPAAYNWYKINRPVRLTEATVAPGQTGTFTFQVRNNNLPAGNHRLDVGLVADGISWFGSNTHAYWDINVKAPYAAAYVSQSRYPTLSNGQIASLTVRYLNTGSTTWRRGVVNLGTVDQDYNWKSEADYHPAARYWVKPNRPAKLTEATVAPGQIGTFTFQVRNYNFSAGNYRLDAGLVADGIGWFDRSTHVYWDINVEPPYKAEFAGQSRYPTLSNNEITTLTIRYKNTGSTTWRKGVVSLGTVDQDFAWKTEDQPFPLSRYWVKPNRPTRLTEDTVAPGQTGTFTFQIRNHSFVPAGTYRLDVGLVADGVGWFERSTHAYWDITARK